MTLVLLLWVTAHYGCALLVLSGVRHLKNPEPFTAVVVAHSLIPFRLVRKSVRTFAVAQVGTGAAGIASAFTGALLTGNARMLWLMLPAAGVYLFLAAYALAVLGKVGRVPCGCFNERDEMSPWTVVRALLLAVASFGYAVTLPAFEVAGLAGCAIGVAIAVRTQSTGTPVAVRS